MRKVLLALSAFLVLAVLTPTVGMANNIAKAKEAYGEAEKYYSKAEFAKALEQYQKAYDLSQKVELLFNIAQCHRQLKDFDKALFFYKLFLEKIPSTPFRNDAEKHISGIEKELGERKKMTKSQARLSIVTNPEGAQVLIDTFQGKPEGVTPVVLTLEAGTHLLVIKKEGYKDYHQKIFLQAGKLEFVDFKLEPLAGKPVDKKPDDVKTDPKDIKDPGKNAVDPGKDPNDKVTEDKLTGKWWFWSGIGATVVLGGLSVMYGLNALDYQDKTKTDKSYESKMNDAALMSDIFMGAAIASAAVTLYFAMTYKPAEKETTKKAFFAPSCTTNGCGIFASFSF